MTDEFVEIDDQDSDYDGAWAGSQCPGVLRLDGALRFSGSSVAVKFDGAVSIRLELFESLEKTVRAMAHLDAQYFGLRVR